MTFSNAPWIVDGALVSSALARRSQYASTSGAEGIVNLNDLKVRPLAVPGVGLLIDPGVGLLLNRYQTNINESYMVSNPGTHTMTSGEMPAANPSAKSYLVAIVVGDPEFSQVGHPWMPTTVPDGEEQTFEYVRPTIIEVPPGTTSADSLGYPAYALARLDMPANTTTITASEITDLRELAQPRSKRVVKIWNPIGTSLSSGSYITFPAAASWDIPIPPWASRALIKATWSGLLIVEGSFTGNVRVTLGGEVTQSSGINFNDPSGATRGTQGCADDIPIPEALRGTTQPLVAQGRKTSGPINLQADNNTSFHLDVEFIEVAE